MFFILVQVKKPSIVISFPYFSCLYEIKKERPKKGSFFNLCEFYLGFL
ncbi:hypothetical protein HMPREF3189_00694 [Clostridiales bacterium KA00134]|nr:hypothetical protein HMPREF3189_00694 [Clostridiales bacterium KA00134]